MMIFKAKEKSRIVLDLLGCFIYALGDHIGFMPTDLSTPLIIGGARWHVKNSTICLSGIEAFS